MSVDMCPSGLGATSLTPRHSAEVTSRHEIGRKEKKPKGVNEETEEKEKWRELTEGLTDNSCVVSHSNGGIFER